MNGLVISPTFFNLSLNLAIRISWSEPQSAPGLVFADWIELLHCWLQINLISVLTIWWCPCVVFSCFVERGCWLWPVCSLGKTLLALAWFHFVFQGQTCLLLQVSLDFLLLHSNLLWKGYLFLVLILESLVGLHRTIQLQLLQHYWLGHRLGLLWYWMVCLGNVQGSFCHFCDCT